MHSHCAFLHVPGSLSAMLEPFSKCGTFNNSAKHSYHYNCHHLTQLFQSLAPLMCIKKFKAPTYTNDFKHDLAILKNWRKNISQYFFIYVFGLLVDIPLFSWRRVYIFIQEDDLHKLNIINCYNHALHTSYLTDMFWLYTSIIRYMWVLLKLFHCTLLFCVICLYSMLIFEIICSHK